MRSSPYSRMLISMRHHSGHRIGCWRIKAWATMRLTARQRKTTCHSLPAIFFSSLLCGQARQAWRIVLAWRRLALSAGKTGGCSCLSSGGSGRIYHLSEDGGCHRGAPICRYYHRRTSVSRLFCTRYLFAGSLRAARASYHHAACAALFITRRASCIATLYNNTLCACAHCATRTAALRSAAHRAAAASSCAKDGGVAAWR